MKDNTLQRFLDAQDKDYALALLEISNGRKCSHWMWYIFPQIAGLGCSNTSKYYAIRDRVEAEEYLGHPVLGNRLVEICQALLNLQETDPYKVFGSPDDMKLRSSLTLFSLLPGAPSVFDDLLQKYFSGVRDSKTVSLLNDSS